MSKFCLIYLQDKVNINSKEYLDWKEIQVHFETYKSSIDFENLEYLPFSYYQANRISEASNNFQRKALLNLPFARRGYIFKNEELNNFYTQMDWYIPNPNYIPNEETLTPEELDWIKKYE